MEVELPGPALRADIVGGQYPRRRFFVRCQGLRPAFEVGFPNTAMQQGGYPLMADRDALRRLMESTMAWSGLFQCVVLIAGSIHHRCSRCTKHQLRLQCESNKVAQRLRCDFMRSRTILPPSRSCCTCLPEPNLHPKQLSAHLTRRASAASRCAAPGSPAAKAAAALCMPLCHCRDRRLASRRCDEYRSSGTSSSAGEG